MSAAPQAAGRCDAATPGDGSDATALAADAGPAARAEVQPYIAMALQTRCEAVNGLAPEQARQRMAATIDRIGQTLRTIQAYTAGDLRLVVLPEYLLTGFPMGEGIAQWQALACVTAGDESCEALAGVAQAGGLFLCVNAYEVDPAFPQLYFQAALVFGPNGDLVLRQRRMISMFACSPYDVWDAYLDRHGLDSVFPVADTAIGRLGAIASEEILYPEIARAQAMRGAEVLLHSTGEFGSPRQTGKEIARLARAVENMAYVVSANASSLQGTGIPPDTTDGMSKIVDYRGLVLAEAAGGETMAAHAEIDITALRRARARPGLANLLSRQPYALYAAAYGQGQAQQPDGLLAADGSVQVPDRAWFKQRQIHTLARLRGQGRI
jgi:predicted amidohydrolase